MRITKALRNAVSRGQLPADLDCRRAAISVHAYMEGIQTNWLLVPDGFSLAGEAENLVDSLMDMLNFSPALRVRTA
ncbi:HTH-type transcriptional regulator TtgR [compost metagenome]